MSKTQVFRKTILATAVAALASSAFGANLTGFIPGSGGSNAFMMLRQDDGTAAFWGHQNAAAALGDSFTCTELSVSSYCSFRIMGSSLSKLATYMAYGSAGHIGNSASLFGLYGPNPIQKVVAILSPGRAWFIGNGKLTHATDASDASATSYFSGISPAASGGNAGEVAALNNLGTVTDALITSSGAYAVVGGNLYYYGNAPQSGDIKVGSDYTSSVGSAATTPVLLHTEVQSVFYMKNGNASRMLGYVDTSGKAFLHRPTAGAPLDLSATLGIGVVSKVYVHPDPGTTAASAVLLADNGVFAEVTTTSGALAITGNVGGAATPHQIPNLSAADISDVTMGKYGEVYFIKSNGTLWSFGAPTNQFSPANSNFASAPAPSFTPYEVPLTAASFRVTAAATKDSVKMAVRVTVAPPAGADSVDLYRATTASGTAVKIANLPIGTTTYDDASVADGQSYWYSARAIQPDGRASPASAAVEGRANVAPTAIHTSVPSIAAGETKTMTLTATDPNPSDTIEFSIASQPQHGTVTLDHATVTYIASDLAYSGSDSFNLTATDQLGNTATLPVTTTVSCPAAAVTGLTQDPIIEWGTGVVQVTYGAPACTTNLRATLTLKDPVSGAIVHTSNTPSTIETGESKGLTFVIKDLEPKSYVTQLDFMSDQNAHALATLSNVVVSAITAPAIDYTKAVWDEYETASVSVGMPLDTNCPITTDPALAAANTGLCLPEFTTIPLGLVAEPAGNAIHATGQGEPVTNTPLNWKVSKWDSLGNKHIVKSGTVTLSFVEGALPIFTLSPNHTAMAAVRDLVKVDVLQAAGANCNVVTSQDEALAIINAGGRACLASFTVPAVATMAFDKTTQSLAGRFTKDAVGTQNLGYTISRQYLNRPARVAATGTIPFTVAAAPADQVFSVAANRNAAVVGYDTITGSIQQSGGQTCALTTSTVDAARSWYADASLKCLLTWPTLPAGMQPSALTASGVLTTVGNQELAAHIAVINPVTADEEFSYDASTSIDATAAIAPKFTFSAEPVIPDSRVYRIISGKVGTLSINDDRLGLSTLSIDAGGAPDVRRGIKKGVNVDIAAPLGLPLWTVKDITVTAAWDRFPTTQEVMSFKAAVLPPKDMKATMTFPRLIVSTMPVTVDVNLGQLSNAGVRFDSLKMGQWKGHLAAVNADYSLRAITTPINITDGYAQIEYQNTNDLANAEIVFVGNLTSEMEGFTMQVVSPKQRITVEDGNGIASTVLASIKSGFAPLTTRLTAQVDTDMQRYMGKIEWLVSADGGNTWGQMQGITSTSSPYAFTQPGTYLVKTRIPNKLSGQYKFSEPVTFHVYAKPTLTIDGPSVTRTGGTIELVATTTAENVKWEILRADGSKTQTEGATLTLESALPQTIQATAFVSAESGANLLDPNAWAKASESVKFVALQPVKLGITATKIMETGKPYTLTGRVSTDFSMTDAEMVFKSQWVLPDNTIIEGNDLTWTPSVANYTNKAIPIYTAWIDGHKDQTMSSVIPAVSLLNYVWPSWDIDVKNTTMQAPAAFRFAVTAPQEQLRAWGAFKEKLTYTWDLPAGITAERTQGAGASFDVLLPGDYSVGLTIEDTRGNTVTLTKVLSVLAPVDIVVETKINTSNKYNRAPVSVSIRPMVAKLHPREKITGFRFLLNDELMDENTKGSTSIDIPEAGDYTITTEINTSLGRQVSTDTPLKIVTNKTPTCTLAVKRGTRDKSVTADCKDTDGKIKAYSWKVDGVAVANTGYRVTVPLTASVEVMATDDAGGQAIATEGKL